MPNVLSYLANLASDSVSRRELQALYTGIAKGQRVNIVGAGPSAAGYKLREGEHTIVLNSSIKQFLDATPEQAKYLHAVTSESTVWLFDHFWGNEAWPGFLLAEKYAGTRMPPEKIIKYPREFWERFVWFERRPSHFSGDNRDCGLWYAPCRFDATGSVQLQAIDLAYRIMGASEVHTIGCELCFTDGAQHWDDWQPYTIADDSVYGEETADHQTQVARFNIAPALASSMPEGQRETAAWIDATAAECLSPSGDVYSTPFYFKSALAIRAYVRDHPDCVLVDHSGGLIAMLDGSTPAPPRKRKAAK